MDGLGLDKEKNLWISLNPASDEELYAYSKARDLHALRLRLKVIYGPY